MNNDLAAIEWLDPSPEMMNPVEFEAVWEALKESAPTWTAVEDEPPPIGTKVLAWSPTWDDWVALEARSDPYDDPFFWFDTEMDGVWENDPPTHWMARPLPPSADAPTQKIAASGLKSVRRAAAAE